MSTRRSFTLPETSPTQRTAVGERILIGRDAGYTQPVATPDGILLALIAYIPLPELFKLVPELALPVPAEHHDKAVYVFSYYDEHDYFLGNITELQPALLDFDHQKFFTPEFNTDPDAMSFIGGSPVYLQHTLPDGLDDYVFVGQISGADLPSSLDDLFYLTENVGYIFVKKDLTGGLFFVQAT